MKIFPEKTNSAMLSGLWVPLIFILLLVFGCGEKIIKQGQKDLTPDENQNENEVDKSTYLDDYEVIDLTDESYVNRGNAYADQGINDKAISEYNNAIKLNSNNFGAFSKRGDAYFAKGDHDKAISDYSKAIEINPDNFNDYFKRGNAHAGKGEFEKAISDYTRAIEINPKNEEVYVKRAIAHSEKGDTQKTVADYEKALENISVNEYDKKMKGQTSSKIYILAAVAHYNLGTDLAENDQFDEAIAAYDRAIELDSSFSEAYNNRGIAYYLKDQSVDVVLDSKIDFHFQQLDRMSDLFQKNISQEKVLFEKAIDNFSRAISLNPLYAEAYFNRGTVYSDRGQYEKAILDFNHALKIDPQYVDAYYNRGNAYAEQGRYEQAIADYTSVIEIKPDFCEAYYNRGNVFILKSEEKEKACLDWQRACAFCNRCDAIQYGRNKGLCN